MRAGLTRAVLGGGCYDTPSGFWHTCPYIFSAHFVKISDPGHQVTSSDITSQKVLMLVIATLTDRSHWNFQRLTSVTVGSYKICISEFWYRWPKVRSILRPLHHQVNGRKLKAACYRRKPFETLKHRLQVELTSWMVMLWPVPPPFVGEVISGHERSSAVFRQQFFIKRQARALKTP